MPSLIKTVYLTTALATAASAAWVPATVKTHPSSKRNVHADYQALTKAMEPTPGADLLYVDDTQPNQNMAINVHAAHDTNKYVVLEEFRDLIKELTCAAGPKADDETDVTLVFDDKDVFTAATKLWATDKELKDGRFLFVTADKDCSPKGDRRVFMASKVTFDESCLKAVITAKPVELGGCPDASSTLTITGGPYQQHMASKRAELAARSFFDDIGNTVSNTVNTVTNTVNNVADKALDLGGVSGEKGTPLPIDIEAKGKTIIDTDKLRLVCNDCHLTGELTPAFVYKIGTAADLAKVFSSGDLKSLVQEASFDLTVTKDIEAKLDFAVSTLASADVSCTFPYGKCSVSVMDVGIGSKQNKMLGKDGFTVGPLTLDLDAGLGMMFDANIAAHIGLNWTSSMTMATGQKTGVNIVDPGASSMTFAPALHAEAPSLNLDELKACVSLGMGGTFTASASIKIPKLGDKPLFSSNLDLFLPKFTYCADDNEKSTDKCDGPGSVHSRKMDVNAQVGVDASGGIVGMSLDTGDKLMLHEPVWDQCKVVDAPKPPAPSSSAAPPPPASSAAPASSSAPASSAISSAASGTTTLAKLPASSAAASSAAISSAASLIQSLAGQPPAKPTAGFSTEVLSDFPGAPLTIVHNPLPATTSVPVGAMADAKPPAYGAPAAYGAAAAATPAAASPAVENARARRAARGRFMRD